MLTAIWIAGFVVAGLLISAYWDKIVAWAKRLYDRIANKVHSAKVVLKRIGSQTFQAVMRILGRDGGTVDLIDPDQPEDHVFDLPEALDLLNKRPEFLIGYYPKFTDLPIHFQDAFKSKFPEKTRSLWPESERISFKSSHQIDPSVRAHFEQEIENDLIIFK